MSSNQTGPCTALTTTIKLILVNGDKWGKGVQLRRRRKRKVKEKNKVGGEGNQNKRREKKRVKKEDGYKGVPKKERIKRLKEKTYVKET